MDNDASAPSPSPENFGVAHGVNLEHTVKANAVAAVDYAQSQPRLGIGHILLYTACVAVSLVTIRNLSGESLADDDAPLSMGVGTGSLQFAWALLGGLALASIPIMFARWWKGMAFPVAPGEWILVGNGIAECIKTVFGLVFAILGESAMDSIMWLSINSQLFLGVGYAVSFGWGTIRLWSERRWALALGGWSVATGLQAFALLLFVGNC